MLFIFIFFFLFFINKNKPFAALKGSERKKFVSTILERFSVDECQLRPEAKTQLVPKEVKSAKIQLHSGEKATLYTDDSCPLFVVLSDGYIIPTVFSIWRNPYLLPVVLTVEYTIERLQNGADLMIPGIFAPYPELNGKPLPSGYVVGIATTKRPNVPLAVGITAVDFAEVDFESDKGKGVLLCNIIGDTLWESFKGEMEIPIDLDHSIPFLGTPGGQQEELSDHQPESNHEDTQHVEHDTLGENTNVDKKEDVSSKKNIQNNFESLINDLKISDSSSSVSESNISSQQQSKLTTSEIDEVFIMALKQSLKKAIDAPIDLPISSSLFLSNHILMNMPYTDPDIQMKRTSWKKAQKFFKAMEKQGLVKSRERSGELVLTSLAGSQNPQINSFALFKPKSYTTSSVSHNTSSSPSKQKDLLLTAKEYWRPHHASVELFERSGLSPTQHFPLEGLKSVITEYINQHDLVNKDNPKLVNVDNVLSKALSTGLATTIGRDKLVSSLQKNCTIFHSINKPGQTAAKIVKGPIPQVKVYVERRTRGKLATRIWNLEAFQLNPITIAEELRVACAGSSTVNSVKEGTDLKEVMVQGSQTKAVIRLLESKGLRSTWIDVHEKK